MSESQETSPSLPPPQAGAEGGLTSAGVGRTLNRMSQRYPRAPSSAAWAAMSPEEQARVHASLPGEVTEEEWGLPEGDWHFHAKKGALEALRTAFAEVLRRKAYVAADLPVYYPDARRFAPDLLVVLDVEPYFRNKWDVNWEKKKLDFILEVHVDGDRKKDTVRNVKRYAALKVPEYFIFDQKRAALEGYRLLVAQLRQETERWKAQALEEAKRRKRETRRRKAEEQRRKAEEQRRKLAEQARDEKDRQLQQAEQENAKLKEEVARLKALLH